MHTAGKRRKPTKKALLAAAPEGLRLAILVVRYFGDGPIDPLLDCDIALRRTARRVIAKATGGAK